MVFVDLVIPGLLKTHSARTPSLDHKILYVGIICFIHLSSSFIFSIFFKFLLEWFPSYFHSI